MLEARHYLAMSPLAARRQWESIITRAPVAGGRQVDFIPVETLLCLAAGLVVNHRRYGGSTSHLAEEPVPSLARLFRRPNSSVLAKMANLDGSRPNGARHEVEVAAKLLASPGDLAMTYRLLLSTARDAGIGPDRLPDFLSVEGTQDEITLLGQAELSDSDVETAVQLAKKGWTIRFPDLDERVTERLLVASARVGQHRFAQDVLRNHGHQCVFCGLAVTAGDRRAQRMLVASHIKPWRVSTNAERRDVQNGLTACPTHDVAFDTGLLTVNGGLRIHVNPQLVEAARADAATGAVFGRPPLRECLLLPVGALPPRDAYLTWHRGQVGWFGG